MIPKGGERTLGPRRSSCLRFQLFRVEMCPFLPDDESDRRYLSRQGEASHRWLPDVRRATQFHVPQTVSDRPNAGAKSDDGNGSFLREQVLIGESLRAD